MTLRAELKAVAVPSRQRASRNHPTVTPRHGGSWGCSGTGRASPGWISWCLGRRGPAREHVRMRAFHGAPAADHGCAHMCDGL